MHHNICLSHHYYVEYPFFTTLQFYKFRATYLRNQTYHYSFISILDSKQYIKMLSYGTWICSYCNSTVNQEVYPCPKCMSGLEDHNQPRPVENHKNQNICPVCTYTNAEHASSCELCDTPLKVAQQIQNPQIKCPKCNQENDAINVECVFCDAELVETQKKQCQICQQKVKMQFFDRHYTSCLLSHEALVKEQEELREQLRKQEQVALKNMEQCIYCRQKFFPQAMEVHTKQCSQQALKNLSFDPKTRMTPLQIEAMRYMTLKSEKEHNAAKGQLQKKIKRLGYTIQDLNNLQFYVQNYAPIIIHIHVSKHMQFFIKDTHYRSQFQTNKSSGSLSRDSRTGWQDRMFDKKYAKAKDFERVKYGVINFTNDPKGVGSCVGYGQSYFLLKEHVRSRCTFTDMDSSNQNSSIATFKHCFKILNKLNDNELKAAIDASKAKEIASSCSTTYKEMQIHGPVEFAKDIERIYVNKNELKTDKKLLDMVYEFNKKFGVEYDFF